MEELEFTRNELFDFSSYLKIETKKRNQLYEWKEFTTVKYSSGITIVTQSEIRKSNNLMNVEYLRNKLCSDKTDQLDFVSLSNVERLYLFVNRNQ